MGELLKVISDSGGACGGCKTTGCGTCGPAPSTSSVQVSLSRRDFGFSALAASAGVLLAGCSKSQPTDQASQPATAPAPAAQPAGLSPDLEVVKESKGPIMTTLEEFYKIGPGP